MKKIILIGGGGHAKVTLEMIRSIGTWGIEGIVDAMIPKDFSVCGVKVLGNDDLLVKKALGNPDLALAFGSIRADQNRKIVFEKFKALGYVFPFLRHPETIIPESVKSGEGSQIMAGVVIQPEVKIGKNCILNTASVIEHDCMIEDHVHIAPGAILGGGVRIGETSFIGLGARILPGVRIGRGVTVGAGAVVIEDVPDGITVVGIPAGKLK